MSSAHSEEPRRAPQLTGTDFTTWKMVTVRPPAANEAVTSFYDLSTLRSATELVLRLPRVGFFTTPAFFANWQTNTSNQMRVTMNQALIVATGAQVDGTDGTAPSSTPGLDAVHASASGTCLGCHRLLDPTRSILSATYSYNYHAQVDPTLTAQPGLFAFEGVVTPVTSVAELGATLGRASAAAVGLGREALLLRQLRGLRDPSDPEFQRLVGVF